MSGQPPPYGFTGPAYSDKDNYPQSSQHQQQYPPQGQQYAPPPPQYSPQGQQYAPPQAQYPPQQGQQYAPPPGQYPALGPGQSVVMQPVAGQPPPPPPPGQQVVQWMQMPASISGCPPGLEYLTQIDQLIAKQQVELLEVLTGFETRNKYKVFNTLGQQVYFAQEESECLMRMFCGPARGFEISITDNYNREVMRFRREFKCCAGCCWCASAECCAFVLQVEAPTGTPVGYVRQEQSGWSPNFSLYTNDNQVLARIHGPCCVCSGPCCGDVEFQVMSPDDSHQIGKVAKQWSGVLREMISDADTFTVSFPMDMDVRMKAVMFGALFLIDFMYFEQNKNRNNHHHY